MSQRSARFTGSGVFLGAVACVGCVCAEGNWHPLEMAPMTLAILRHTLETPLHLHPRRIAVADYIEETILSATLTTSAK